ncbi:MAG TPA: DUF2382 domain-containing protein, partial [Bacillota bacterium]|nr:DUF2382 domain-containing protein [Bacillota bacterium]
MTPFKEFSTLHLSLLGVSLLALASGCASQSGGTYSSTPTYYSATGATESQPGTVASSTDTEMSMAQKRTDITDTGPGTPRGDATSANPSETSSQGAGSRALVGQGSARETAGTTQGGATVAQGGTSSTLPGEGTAQGSASVQGASAQASTNLVVPLHKEELRVGKREVDAGTVTVRKNVRTETVNEPVQLRT